MPTPAPAPAPVAPAPAPAPQKAPATSAPTATKPAVILQPEKPTHPLLYLAAGVVGAALIGAIGEGLKDAIKDRLWNSKRAQETER